MRWTLTGILKRTSFVVLLLVVLMFAGIHIFNQFEDVNFYLTNNTSEMVTDDKFIYGRDDGEIYDFGKIAPGETAKLHFLNPGEAPNRIEVTFESGRKLYLQNYVYLDFGPATGKFSIESDKIAVLDFQYSREASAD